MRTHTCLAMLCTIACTTDVHVADDVGVPASTSDTSGGSSTGGTPEPSTSSSAAATSTGDASDDDGSGGDELPKYDVPATDTEGPLPEGCIGGNDKVWVFALNEDAKRHPDLYRFDPDAPSFEWVADLECLPLKKNGDTPISLGVARDGVAYFSMNQPEQLWSMEVLADSPCDTIETIDWNPPGGTNSLVYVALDPATPENETLFAHTLWAQTFGEVRLDLPEVIVDYIGASPEPYMTLAGSGDGRLFAVGGPDVVADGQLVTIDPATGMTIDVLTLVNTSTYPAFFAGDVLLFDVNQQDVGDWAPRVMRYDLDDDDGDGEHATIEIYGEADDPPNLWIRGVASPTCIPVTPEG